MNAAEKIDFGLRHVQVKILDVVSAYIALRAARTQVVYCRVWEEWCAFCSGDFVCLRPEAATEAHALRFCASQRGRGIREATIKHKAVILQGIYGYLKDQGIVSVNIFRSSYEALKHARTGDLRPSQPLTPTQAENLLNAPDGHTVTGIRDRALVALLFSCFRVGEVLAFALRDFRQTPAGSYYMIVRHPKAQHQQQAAIPRWCAERVAALIAQRRGEGASDADMLFVSYGGRGLWKHTDGRLLLARRVNRDLKRYAQRVGITTDLSAHWGRCTAICRLLETCDHAQVQAVSRHASIQMVERYDRRRRDLDESPGNLLDYSRPAQKRDI